MPSFVVSSGVFWVSENFSASSQKAFFDYRFVFVCLCFFLGRCCGCGWEGVG